jgi:hypothetical protein
MHQYGYGKHGGIEVIIIGWQSLETEWTPDWCLGSVINAALQALAILFNLPISFCVCARTYVCVCIYTGFLNTVITKFQVIIATNCQPLMWCMNIN